MDKKYYVHTKNTFTDKDVIVEVSKEIYEIITKSYRKERYFLEDLKSERFQVNQENQTVNIVRSREDSYERLTQEVYSEFSDGYMFDTMFEQHLLLSNALCNLKPDEQELMYYLYFKDLTEREYSKISGIPQKTINNRKRRILKKMKYLLD